MTDDEYRSTFWAESIVGPIESFKCCEIMHAIHMLWGTGLSLRPYSTIYFLFSYFQFYFCAEDPDDDGDGTPDEFEDQDGDGLVNAGLFL